MAGDLPWPPRKGSVISWTSHRLTHQRLSTLRITSFMRTTHARCVIVPYVYERCWFCWLLALMLIAVDWCCCCVCFTPLCVCYYSITLFAFAFVTALMGVDAIRYAPLLRCWSHTLRLRLLYYLLLIVLEGVPLCRLPELPFLFTFTVFCVTVIVPDLHYSPTTDRYLLLPLRRCGVGCVLFWWWLPRLLLLPLYVLVPLIIHSFVVRSDLLLFPLFRFPLLRYYVCYLFVALPLVLLFLHLILYRLFRLLRLFVVTICLRYVYCTTLFVTLFWSFLRCVVPVMPFTVIVVIGYVVHSVLAAIIHLFNCCSNYRCCLIYICWNSPLFDVLLLMPLLLMIIH